MKQFKAQYYKEFSAYFYGFNAYIILGIYSVLSLLSALYAGEYFLRETDVMNAYFIMQPLVLILIIPSITMRLWAEEIKSGTIELLLTQPISYSVLTLAKFSAASTFFIVMLAFSAPLLITSYYFSMLDTGVIFSAYVGLLLCGVLFIAAGCFLSAICRNNIISYMATIFLLFIISQFKFDDISEKALFVSLDILNFSYNYNAFLNGIVSWGNGAYYICGTFIFLWLNIFFLNHRQSNDKQKQQSVTIFIFLLILIFFSMVISFHLLLPQEIDATSAKRYTLLDKHADYLRRLDKRINITLYEAKIKRDEENSNYAALADYVERLLKRIQLYSEGNVRYEISRVESLSASERQLIQENIPYEEDNWGNKIYMIADFSDNEGNHQRINAFNSLRQNFIETDILRSLHQLDKNKKNIAIFASKEELKNLKAVNNTLQEFYNVTYLDNEILYIPSKYEALIAINPMYISTETLLAMEQYIMNGGSLILFHEPSLLSQTSGRPIIQFLNTYGVQPIISTDTAPNSVFAEGVQNQWSDMHFILTHGAGDIQTKTSPLYKTISLLDINGKTAAVKSVGKYVTNFPDIAAQSEEILSVSNKEGNVFFIYDSDILHDDIFVSEALPNMSFYQMLPLTDNMLFLLRLVDYATDRQIESEVSYRHYPVNLSSIGVSIFNTIKKRYEDKTKFLNQQLDTFTRQRDDLKNMLHDKGYVSAKQIGDINNITKKIDDTIDELNRVHQLINKEYQSYIAVLTILLVLVIPSLMLLIFWLIIFSIKKYRLYTVRRLIANA